MRSWAAGLADVVVVLVFVAIGRASHQEGDALLGIAATAWPFLAGLVVGWVVVRAWRAPYAVVPAGVAAWVAAVVVGMLLRVVSGQGTAVAFVIVATVFLGVFLLGWRAVAALARRRFAPGR
ncbi:MAG TPA: DUF3054 domain-containing protein [Streptosporangiaceae bacterium]|jgi:hypothetical protein